LWRTAAGHAIGSPSNHGTAKVHMAAGLDGAACRIGAKGFRFQVGRGLSGRAKLVEDIGAQSPR